MLLPLYILSLGLASGIAGVFGRRVVAMAGFMPDFQSGVYIAWGIACIYAAAQVLYMGNVRFLKPTHGGVPVSAEIMSNAAALLLVPYLLDLPFDWPHPILEKVEPLIYISAFLVAHVFFKLVSLFGATQSLPAGRLGAVGWFSAFAGCLLGVQVAYAQWHGALQEARLAPAGDMSSVRVGDTYLPARGALEGALYNIAIPETESQTMTLRWAWPSALPERPAEIFVTIYFPDSGVDPVFETVQLTENEWAEIQLTPDMLAEAGDTCTISWRAEEEAGWMRKTGLRPVDSLGREILMSGPHFHAVQDNKDAPNLLMIVVDGIGSEHLDFFGYDRETAPNLKTFASGAAAFGRAYAPAPETAAGVMSLFTGLGPLTHGYLGDYSGPLPETVVPLAQLVHDIGYHTAAFTEGESPERHDLVYGTGFEQGFELFNVEVPPGGSKTTLTHASEWMQAHQADRQFVFVRLRELGKPQTLARYGTTFYGDPQSPRPLDVYDTVLFDIDKQLGAFLAGLQASPLFENTIVVIASPYGLDYSAGWGVGGSVQLSEQSLRVPLLMRGPGIVPEKDMQFVGLEDAFLPLTTLLGLKVPYTPSGLNLLEPQRRNEVVSVSGEPLALSLRDASWRFTWQSGRYIFSDTPPAPESVLEFLNITYYEKNWKQPDSITRQISLSQTYRQRLLEYLQKQTGR